MRDTEVILPVVSFFTLAHSVVRGRALIFNHTVSVADGAVQACGQEVPELCEVPLGAGLAHGVEGVSAWCGHVRPRRAEFTEQGIARSTVFVLQGVNLVCRGIGGH